MVSSCWFPVFCPARSKGSAQGLGFPAPSVLEFLAGTLCRRGGGCGVPRSAGAARLRREHIAVLLLARRFRPVDPDRRPAAVDPEGKRCLAGRDRAPAAPGAAA